MIESGSVLIDRPDETASSTPTLRARRGREAATLAIVGLAIIVATAAGIAAESVVHSLNSDELAWQRLLDIWMHEGHRHAWISEDILFPRFALYLLLDVAGVTGRNAALVTAGIMSATGSLAMATAMVIGADLHRPVRTRTAIALVLSACWAPFAWAVIFFNPNSRSLELGLALLGVAALGLVLSGRLARPVTLVALTAALALLWLSDPFVLYYVGITVAIVVAVEALERAKRRRALVVLGVLAASAFVSVVLRRAIELVDVTAKPVGENQRNITAVGDLPERTWVVLGRIVDVLGISGTDLTRGPADVAAVAWVRVVVVALGVVGAVMVVRRWRSASLLPRTMAGALVTTPVIVVVVNQFDDPARVMDRYLCMVPIALVVLAVVAVDGLRGVPARVATVAVTLVVIGAIATGARLWWNGRDVRPDDPAVRLAAAAQAAGFERVYGYYWLTVPPDQLVDGGVRWVTVDCAADGRLRLEEWNNDDAVVAPSAAPVAVALDGLCASLADLTDAYGAPSDVVTLDGTRFAVWTDPPPALVHLT